MGGGRDGDLRIQAGAVLVKTNGFAPIQLGI